MHTGRWLLFGALLGCGLAPYTSGTEGGGAMSTGGEATAVTPTTGGASGESAGSSGCGFLPCGVDVGVVDECDVWKQDCPEGQKCVPYASGGGTFDAHKCVPVAPGAGGAGEPCTVEGSSVSGIDDCAKGLICWDVDGALHGTCVPQCAGSLGAPVCPACSSCVVANDAVLTLCLPTCSPVLQDCPRGQHCIPWNDGFLCVVDEAGEAAGVFAPCEYASACERGLWCGPPKHADECDPKAPGCCLPFCDLAEPSCPGEMQLCAPWFAEAPGCAQYEDVGSCRTSGTRGRPAPP